MIATSTVSQATVSPLPAYDPDAVRASRLTDSFDLFAWAHRIFAVLRAVWPIPSAFGWAAVTRYEDVAEVLRRSDAFGVPFDKEIAFLNDGTSPGTAFLLGIDDYAAHCAQARLLMQAFRRSDIDGLGRMVYHMARECIARQRVEFDAIQALITRVPLGVCAHYYGVALPDDPRTFACATMDLSGHLFGLPPVNGTASPQVLAAGTYVRSVIDAAIARGPRADDSRILDRLLGIHAKHPTEFTRKHVRAFLIGMIVGFVPTNTMAGGHILEVLLDHPDYLAQAQSAARDGDDDRLWRCLFEALRFMPHNLGPFRICKREFVVAADTPRATRIKADTKVLAATMSAMFDARQVLKPKRFEPERPASDYMLFGTGMHWCVGAAIAQVQLTQTFKALLEAGRLERLAGLRGRLKRRGGFPDRLYVLLDRGQR